VPEESELDLPGYPGGSDRIGNRVTTQFQLDVFGEALVVLADAARLDRLSPEGWKAATVAVDAIAKRWREPDSGIWELEPRRWTHSRLSCAAGLRAIARCAPAAEAADWLSLADTLVADAAATGVHPSGRWKRADDDDRIDAALLLPGLRGALGADDPRTIATLEAVQKELTQDGYVYRFRPDARPLGEAEGAFLLCGFFLCLAQHAHGDNVAAVRCFERHRAACGPPGLYSEEYDVAQRQMRSNLPQAFVHALLIESAVTLTRPFRDAATS
jgi:GH15 family glucan-1,4-alpha-glucosidase